MAILNNSNAISSGGYDINNSLRFRSSASAYLNRTPASASNRRTWTWSGWVKRGQISIVNNGIFSAGTSFGTNNNNLETISFPAADTLEIASEIGGSTQYRLITTQVFRDPSAWYHVVVAIDTTQATSSNRIKLYINGTQVTAFGTATYPTQNYDCWTNSTNAHRIGSRAYPDFDGYMTEVNFIDGSAKTPSDFGETDTTTGVWKPKAYTGTYGTNGFYLKFSDIATTSGSNAGLGKDFSGNANYWNTNNISVTAGTTYDAMTDVPTLTSATVANYAVLNPLSKGTNASITNANLSVSYGAAAWTSAFGTMGVSTGKWYWEITLTSAGTDVGVGISTNPAGSANSYIGSDANSWGYYASNGNKWNNNSQTAYGATYANGDVIGVALDLDAGTLVFYKNNTSQGTAFSSLASNTYFPALSVNNSSFAANFGQRPFAYTPPTGFVRLNTFNLPTPTILQGNKYMDATLYTGNGSTQTITNAGAFKPDLVWAKDRVVAANHRLIDSNRGASKILYSSLTLAEATDASGLTSFNSNGFSVGSTQINDNTDTYVAWQWQAGQGSTSSNTSGSITSTVSVSTTAGFSVVTWTATNGNATIGHGLGVAPKMIIIKDRATAANWTVYHASIGNTAGLVLNDTSASNTNANFWNNTTPTSTVFSVGSFSNYLTDAHVAYCWAEIAGFSKFGSYTGNGSADGPFVYTGFRPKYIVLKSTTTAGSNWWAEDTSRSTYNAANALLFPNLSNAEYTTAGVETDILSNGFKLRTSSNDGNKSGDTFIYMAFAENPFKNALAR